MWNPWRRRKSRFFFDLKRNQTKLLVGYSLETILLRKGSRPVASPYLYNAPYTPQFMRRKILNTNIYVHMFSTMCLILCGLYNSGHYIRVNILNAVHLHCKYGYFVRIFSKNRTARERETRIKRVKRVNS